MNIKQLLPAALMCSVVFSASAQKPMTIKDVQDFQRITSKSLSSDGRHIIAVTEPWRGDADRSGNMRTFAGEATARVYDSQGRLLQTFYPAASASFAPGGGHAVFTVKSGDTQQLVIYTIDGAVETVDSLRSFKMSPKSDVIAWQRGRKDSTLYIRSLVNPGAKSARGAKAGKGAVRSNAASGQVADGQDGYATVMGANILSGNGRIWSNAASGQVADGQDGYATVMGANILSGNGRIWSNAAGGQVADSHDGYATVMDANILSGNGLIRSNAASGQVADGQDGYATVMDANILSGNGSIWSSAASYGQDLGGNARGNSGQGGGTGFSGGSQTALPGAAGGPQLAWPAVTGYQYSPDGRSLCFTAAGSGIGGKRGLFLLKEGWSEPVLLKEGDGSFKNISFAKEGSTLAFVYVEKESGAVKGTGHANVSGAADSGSGMELDVAGLALGIGSQNGADRGDAGKAQLWIAEDGAPASLLQDRGGKSESGKAQLWIAEDGAPARLLQDRGDKSVAGKAQLWIAEDGAPARLLLDSVDGIAPEGWVISDAGRLSFSDDCRMLLFATAPAARKKDTAPDRPNVQVWSWDEPVQYTAQDYSKDRDARRTYTAVIDLGTGQASQLTSRELPNLSIQSGLKSQYAILSTSEPYSASSMWEGSSRSDYYRLDLTTGEKTLMKKADYTRWRLSPEGKYAYAYKDRDSVWVSIDMATLQEYQLTDKSFHAWDTDNDVPDYPGSYGSAGWTAGDAYIILYDRYDIYRIPAKGGRVEKITAGGSESGIQYRLTALGEGPVDLSKPLMLTGFNEATKGGGYYRLQYGRSKKPVTPVLLMAGDWKLSSPVKAENADIYMFTKERYDLYPDICLSDASFKKTTQITHEGDQQQAYVWGTAELISWTSYTGKKLQGVVYKPSDFDPSKKYPMVVNFYERNSETLHSYHMPEPHRSTPDYHFYNSHGYIVFNPDIIYTDGHPGECAYDCVMSGIDEVLKGGYVDEKRIGAAGHSWGGYQTAYLATRTDRFAALESGAPVVNMYSAYGGIRWGSGMARAFQYEHGQSRIGKSIWEAPELYHENSPLFFMEKVTTPLLIMHNDTDGHVPWYQGIEFTVALKRLGKVYWMLNYTGEPHWPTKMANKMDFQTRMMQFFDHYLKGEPMPKWMSEGVRAVDQPYELGY